MNNNNNTEPKFVYVTFIATTPEELWTALTNPEFTQQYWFNTTIESNWQVGSRVAYRSGDKVSDDGVVLQYDPHSVLSYTFHHMHSEESRNEKPSRVTFKIEIEEPEAPGLEASVVKLTVIHDDFVPDSVVYPRISNGWPYILSSLKTLLESGRALNFD